MIQLKTLRLQAHHRTYLVLDGGKWNGKYNRGHMGL